MHFLGFVAGDIVHDEVQDFPFGTPTIKEGKKLDVFLVSVAVFAFCYYFTACNLKRGKQSSDAMTLVVMRLPFRDALA